jgi:hypothetical protein
MVRLADVSFAGTGRVSAVETSSCISRYNSRSLDNKVSIGRNVDAFVVYRFVRTDILMIKYRTRHDD